MSGPERTRGRWIPDSQGGVERAWQALTDTGMDRERVLAAVANLTSRGLIVLDGYYVPSLDDLYAQYRKLGEANLHDWIKVRWVMCRETNDALVEQYGGTRVPIPPKLTWITTALTPDAIIEPASLLVVDGGRLFDIPIRIDPAARRPMFEVMP